MAAMLWQYKIQNGDKEGKEATIMHFDYTFYFHLLINLYLLLFCIMTLGNPFHPLTKKTKQNLREVYKGGR